MKTETENIIVKYPTRNRPVKFKENLNKYISTSSLKMTFIISIDTDDASMNNQEIKDFLASKNSERINLQYFLGPSKGKINAINRNIPSQDWNILIATADDMVPFPSWDKMITADFGTDLFRALNYNTDPRLEEQGRDFKSLVTLPIIGKKLYDHFGYIYHPSYKSEYCDIEQTFVFDRMNILTHIDKRPIVHKWHENQDDLMRKNITEGYSDRIVYEQRKTLGFPA